MKNNTRSAGFATLVAVAAIVLVTGFTVATQYTAARLSYSQRLGAPLIVVARTPLYAPWAWLGWSQRFDKAAPAVLAAAQGIGFGGALVAVLFVAAAAGMKGRSGSTAHGSAHWATEKDLAAAGMLEPSGVVLCHRFQPARAQLSSVTPNQW